VIPRLAARLARMDAHEVAWRGKAAARTMVDRARARLVRPSWNRKHLLATLADPPEGDGHFRAARAALDSGAWDEAHAALARHFSVASQRFVTSPRSRDSVVARIRAEFPDAARDAAERADRIVAGEYDLLGFQGLRFDSATTDHAPVPDWQFDPVHGRRPPQLFWSTVPYLAAESGDHKIIWELNRHQSWLVLGRAFWLTGEARYRDRFIAELESWIAANPPLTGVNWASMLELAFRSISWLWAIQFFSTQGAGDRRVPWLVDLLLVLDRQLTHVEENLSYYFSPNTHLLGEALALYVAGQALPELAASARRASTGRTILLDEIDRQIGADGGHCERSTHYHRYTLDFYALALTIARITGDEPAAARFEDTVSRLGTAARLLADDGGIVPHIGDDDGGALLPIAGRAVDDWRDSLAIAAALVHRPELQVGAAPEEAVWMLGAFPSAISHQPSAISHGVASAALPDTGYFVSRSAAGGHIVIDGGPHGYQNGGHAHADALSLTVSLGGVPLLIDPGTGCYTTDPALRDRLRSTALHNTLTLDDRPQSTSNGPFHWSYVANGRVNRWRASERFDYFDGAHDGYAPIEHRRRVFVLHGDLVVVADLADGAGAHRAAVHWHLDPGWTVDLHGRRAELTRVDRKAARVGLAVPQGLLEQFSADADTGLGWHSPVYGRMERTTTLRVSHDGAAPFWMVSVFDLDPGNPVVDVDYVPVWAEAGTFAHAAALRIARATSVDHMLVVEPADGAQTTGGSNAKPAQQGDREHSERSSSSAVSAVSAVKRGLWRVGEVETDARMLFYRATAAQPIAMAALVDGSMLRVSGRREFQLALPRREHAYFSDFGTKDPSLCVASPVS
jgi:hypothetical protein